MPPAPDSIRPAHGDGRIVLHRVVVGPLETNCWLVHADGHHDALVVDPGDDPGVVLAALKQNRLDVRAVVLTHAHFDHVLAVPKVTAALGVPTLAHPDDADVWPDELAHLRAHGHWDAGTATSDLLRADPAFLTPDPSRPLWDGTSTPVADGHQVQLGPLTATLLHTPGHTPGGLTVAVDGHLLTGDTLFPGGPGLTGAAWPRSSFTTIMHSVDRLISWPDNTIVHPGHGRDTTVGAERPHVEEWRQRGW